MRRRALRVLREGEVGDGEGQQVRVRVRDQTYGAAQRLLGHGVPTTQVLDLTQTREGDPLPRRSWGRLERSNRRGLGTVDVVDRHDRPEEVDTVAQGQSH